MDVSMKHWPLGEKDTLQGKFDTTHTAKPLYVLPLLNNMEWENYAGIGMQNHVSYQTT